MHITEGFIFVDFSSIPKIFSNLYLNLANQFLNLIEIRKTDCRCMICRQQQTLSKFSHKFCSSLCCFRSCKKRNQSNQLVLRSITLSLSKKITFWKKHNKLRVKIMLCFLRLCKSFYIVDGQAICIKFVCTFRKTKNQLLISHILRYEGLKVAISPSAFYVTGKERVDDINMSGAFS